MSEDKLLGVRSMQLPISRIDIRLQLRPPRASRFRDANWIDGLRGFCSLAVVIGHLVTAFAPHIHRPVGPFKPHPELFQIPFFRICVTGRTAVALFVIIIGYVNTRSAFARAHEGNIEEAFQSLGRSVFSRAFKLILPTSIATFISWTLRECNAYWMTEHVDAIWIRQGFTAPHITWGEAVISLLKGLAGTWTLVWNENLDGTQWSLSFLLQATMAAYLVTLAALTVTSRARRIMLLGVWIYGWLSGNALVFMNVAVGIAMADVGVQYGDKPDSLPGVVPFMSIVIGILCAGFPQDAPEAAPWSDAMQRTMLRVTPHGVDIRRYWDSIGATFLFLGIYLSGRVQRQLMKSWPNFLGRVSFAVYLLHNQFIKTVLTWIVYLPSYLKQRSVRNAVNSGVEMHQKSGFGADQKLADLTAPSRVYVVAACGICMAVLYKLAWQWTIRVEPFCGRIVARLIRAAQGGLAGSGANSGRRIAGQIDR